MNGIKSYLASRTESNLTRWHSRLMVQPRESLMNHEGSTARIALAIALALRHYRIAEPDLEAVLTGALAHDVAETVTGDAPGGHLKTRHPAFLAALEAIEREAESEIYGDLPQPIGDYLRAAARRKDDGTLEGQIIGYADKLDAFHFACAEVALGHAMNEPGDPPQTTREALARCQWPWLKRLRHLEGLP